MSVIQSFAKSIGMGLGIGMFFIGVAIGGLLLWGYIQGRIQDANKEQLSDLIGSQDLFLSVLGRSETPNGDTVELGNAVVRARPVFICAIANIREYRGELRRPNEIDLLTLDLLEEIRPKKAAEVNTVIALYWGQISHGTYNGRRGALQETCKVEVYDLASMKLLCRRSFKGEPPPTTIRIHRDKQLDSREPVFGTGCEAEIIQYVKAILKTS